MKYFIILITSLLSINTVLAQKADTMYKVEIDRFLNQYIHISNNSEWDSLLDMVYPKLFSLTPRSTIRQSYTKIQYLGIKLNIEDYKIKEISDLIVYKQEQYVLVEYYANIDVEVLKEEMKTEKMMNIMMMQFMTEYGSQNVHFDENAQSFKIKSEKIMYAIAPKGSKNWKFLESKKSMEAIINSLIPEEVQEKIK